MTPSPGFLHLAWTQFNEENHEKKYKIIAFKTVYVHAKLPQSCSTLCNPMDCSLPGSSLCPWNTPDKDTGYKDTGQFPTTGDLPWRDDGMEPASLMSLALAGKFFTTSAI